MAFRYFLSKASGPPHQRSCCFSPTEDGSSGFLFGSNSLPVPSASALARSLSLSLPPSQAHPSWGVWRGRGPHLNPPGQSFELLDGNSQSTGMTYRPLPSPCWDLQSPIRHSLCTCEPEAKGDIQRPPHLCRRVPPPRAHGWGWK